VALEKLTKIPRGRFFLKRERERESERERWDIGE
jgi:hypothetical protein